MKRTSLLLSLATLLAIANPLHAAFVKRYPVTATTTTGTAAATAQSGEYADAPRTQSTTETKEGKTKKQYKKGYGLAAFILGLIGAGTAVLAISLISTSLLGAILLGVITIVLGLSAIGCASIDKKSLLPRKGFATIGKVLGILESLPVLILVVIGAFFYALFGGGKHKRRNR